MPEDFQPKPRALWIAALIFGVLVIADSWFRWATFQYRTFDLAFYVQSFWLTLNGKSQTSILDVSLMGNHAEPICYLLLPLFWVWKHPMFFVVIQALVVLTMPFTGYRIARRMEFEPRGALFLGLATLLAPATGYMVLHEFHPETLAAPLLLLMLEARFAQRVATFWLWFLLALACKENVAVLLAWFCAVHYMLERKKPREWQMAFNVIPAIVASAWVLLYALWISPKLNGGRVAYDELYGHVGGIGGIFTSPGRAIGSAWHAATGGNLVWGLLLPFVFLPLLRPRWLIIAAPIFAQHLLSFRSSEWTIHFHYAAPLLPLMWFAAAEACSRLFWRDVMAGWVIAACVVCQIWIGPIRSVLQTITTVPAARENAKVRSEMLEAIPPEASVVAGLPYLSHLAKRDRLYSLHHILAGQNALNQAEHVPRESTDFVIIDAADTATFDSQLGYYHSFVPSADTKSPGISESEVLLDGFLTRAAWKADSRNELTILRRETALVQNIQPQSAGKPLDQHHTLFAAQLSPPLAGDAAAVTLTLQVKAGRSFAPWAAVYLKAADGLTYQITRGPVGLGSPPDRMVTESWSIRPPSSIPKGRYRAFLLFYDNHQAAFKASPRLEERSFDLGELQLQ